MCEIRLVLNVQEFYTFVCVCVCVCVCLNISVFERINDSLSKIYDEAFYPKYLTTKTH